MKKIFVSFTLLFFLIPVGYSSKLIFVSMITRHGDRAPFANIENANYSWGTELSELTPIGMNQEYNLGLQLRKRYIDKFWSFYQSIMLIKVSMCYQVTQIVQWLVLKVCLWVYIQLVQDR